VWLVKAKIKGYFEIAQHGLSKTNKDKQYALKDAQTILNRILREIEKQHYLFLNAEKLEIEYIPDNIVEIEYITD